MEYRLKEEIFSEQRKVLASHGDYLWEALCDTFSLDTPFTLKEAGGVFVGDLGVTPRVAEQYAKAVLENIFAGGHGVVKKVGGGRYQL